MKQPKFLSLYWLNKKTMNTYIVRADAKLSKVLVAIFKALNVSFEEKKEKSDEESPYDPEFVKKILERTENAKKGNVVTINPKDLWGSLGLK